MLWLFILPPKEGLFVVNFMLFTQGFDWFLFVTKYNPPGPSQGSTHGEANDKLIMAVLSFRNVSFSSWNHSVFLGFLRAIIDE